MLYFALPAFAQTDRDAEPIDPWEHFEVGSLAEDPYLPLRLGRDLTGFGLRARAALGWDTNIFREENDARDGFLLDGMARVHAGARAGLVAFGARGHAAARLYFGDADADTWDIKLGGFAKVPYSLGGLGFGISGDALYQRVHVYEITSAVERRDDLRATGAIARAHAGWAFSLVTFELGVTGEAHDFTETGGEESLDHWKLILDASATFAFYDTIRLKPYVQTDYVAFRDLVERNVDGSERDDNLDLLRFEYGGEIDLELGFMRAHGAVYGRRQDDGAAGFERYWQFGARAAATIFLVGDAYFTTGGEIWTREYDKRPATDSDGNQSKLIERHVMIWGELGWNFWEFFSLGARYRYTRRVSGLDGGGYIASEAMVFLEIEF
jgi:hypothetical protein